MDTQAIDALVRSLQVEFRSPSNGASAVELLGEYARTQDDWRAFALFSDQHYTRNLVVREPRFELMVLCWSAGQESAIHNHEGQDCWMAVLDGEVEEVRYPIPDGPRGPLAAKGAATFRAGQVAFIRDEIGLHLVRPARTSASGGVTLHLYASPYDECNCYCPETGTITRKRLGYHSIRGQVVA